MYGRGIFTWVDFVYTELDINIVICGFLTSKWRFTSNKFLISAKVFQKRYKSSRKAAFEWKSTILIEFRVYQIESRKYPSFPYSIYLKRCCNKRVQNWCRLSKCSQSDNLPQRKKKLLYEPSIVKALVLALKKYRVLMKGKNLKQVGTYT